MPPPTSWHTLFNRALQLKAGKVESEHTKAATAMGMDGCGLPIVVHGDLKINQSFACQSYFAALGPNFPHISPQQQAVDDTFTGSWALWRTAWASPPASS